MISRGGGILFTISVTPEELASWTPLRLRSFLEGLVLVMSATSGSTLNVAAGSPDALAAVLAAVDQRRGTSPEPPASDLPAAGHEGELVAWDEVRVGSFLHALPDPWHRVIDDILAGHQPENVASIEMAHVSLSTRASRVGAPFPIQKKRGLFRIDPLFAELYRRAKHNGRGPAGEQGPRVYDPSAEE